MSNYIYTNGELVNADRLVHADMRRQISANKARAAYTSRNRTNKVPKGSSGTTRNSPVNNATNNYVGVLTNVPADLRDYVEACLRLGLYLPDYSAETLATLRYWKNAGYTPQDFLKLMLGSNPTSIPGGLRKLFNLSLTAQKLNK